MLFILGLLFQYEKKIHFNFLVVSKAPLYIKDYTHLYFTGSKTLQSKVSVPLLIQVEVEK